MKETAIITGGGSGLGQAIAWNLAAQGLTVFIIGRTLATLKQTQEKFPDAINIVSADLTDTLSLQKIKEAIADTPINFLIQNAGTIEPICPLEKISALDFRNALAINLEAPIFLMQVLMDNLSNARVLHVSSFFAHNASHSSGAYCISKAALYMAKEVLNLELNSKNILVGSVMPGIIDTAMQTILNSPNSHDFPDKAFFIQLKKENRLLKPTTVARFISYILMNSREEMFTKDDWDIYDTVHHAHWLGDELFYD